MAFKTRPLLAKLVKIMILVNIAVWGVDINGVDINGGNRIMAKSVCLGGSWSAETEEDSL
jgi:hypothetical protein